MVGPRTIDEHITPRIRRAATAAERPDPRILAGVPVCVTDAPERARSFAAEKLELYGQLPAYRAMLEREGVDGPEGTLAAGSEDAVREQVTTFQAAGATDLRVAALCPTLGEEERTHAFLHSICAQGNFQ
ncbi:MAG: hypothetical protein JRH01_08805 [Deltaproteobacteria bacterium]|nr:hypothetical protein [Deltaproteobacteria bacterium]MBW2396788.1 hypothetical protein [Deltaproteobacteria bacterium]